MIALSGYVLIALGIGHTVVGVLMYGPALQELFRAGYINAASGHTNRLLAFWFLLFSALLLLSGHLTVYAAKANDVNLLKILGWYIGAIGIAGALALPRSPFWAAVVIGPYLLWTAYAN